MLPNAFQDVRRILAVRLDNIGDVVLLSPALRALKQAFPASKLTLMASPGGSQVAPLLPWVDDVITWRAVWQEIKGSFDQGPEKEHELVQRLKRAHFDAAFIFTSFSQSPYPPAYACYQAGIRYRVGQSKEFGGFLLTHWVHPEADAAHQAERNLYLLTSAGIPVQDDHLELCIPMEVEESAGRILQQAGLPAGTAFILAAPGASAASRRYDPRRFALAVDGLEKASGLPVVVIGSQRETALLEPFARARRKNKGIFLLTGVTTVPELAAIIHKSSMVLANNSASLHMAEALGRPMVILYSGTEEISQWAPRYSPARLLRREVFCSPCYAFQCPYKMECLDIPPEEVVSASLNILAVPTSTTPALFGALTPTTGK